MANVQLIVSDLDGTLLSPDHLLEQTTLACIRRYRAQGGRFTIATGRPYATAKSVLRQVEPDLPVILCNGAVLATRDGIVERNPLHTKGLADMLAEAHESGLNVLQFQGDRIDVFIQTSEVKAYEAKEGMACGVIPIHEQHWRDRELDKIILLGDIRVSRGLWERHEERFGHTVSSFQSEYNYLEIVSGKCSKGEMLKQLALRSGIPKENIMAIGNQMNDLPMFEAAGIGVAVANSPDELKKAADYVSEASYGAGVVEAMERYAFGRS